MKGVEYLRHLTSKMLIWKDKNLPDIFYFSWRFCAYFVFVIYRNHERLDTVGGDMTFHRQKGLKPFTEYVIRVRKYFLFLCFLLFSVNLSFIFTPYFLLGKLFVEFDTVTAASVSGIMKQPSLIEKNAGRNWSII